MKRYFLPYPKMLPPKILPIDEIMLNCLDFMHSVGSWVCAGAGIILIMAGAVFAMQRLAMSTPVSVAVNIASKKRRPSILKPIACLSVGGVLILGGWTYVTELSRQAYLQLLSVVADSNPDYLAKVEKKDDSILSEPTVDEVLDAFEEAGGILAEGFRESMDRIPDILKRINRVLLKSGFKSVDEKMVENAIQEILDSMQINSE